MKISTFGYTIKQGIKNIWTNKMFSIAAIATMAACIFMFGMFYAIVANFQHVVKDVESSVAITVFFDEGTTQDEIDEIGQKIAMRPEVSSFNFVSAVRHGRNISWSILMEMKRQQQASDLITLCLTKQTMRFTWKIFPSRAVWYLTWKARIISAK